MESLLPPRFTAWFEGRGWSPRRHQLSMIEMAKLGKDALLIAPTGGGNRWAGLVTGLLPLLLGVGLALATGSWMFLGFTAISAVSLSVAAFSGRQARREFRRALGQAVSEDIKRRNRSSP